MLTKDLVYSALWFTIKLQLHKGFNLVVYYILTTFWVTWPRLQMWKCRIFITFAVRKMPQEHSIFVSFLPCAISQKNFLDSNPTFMQICQLQLEFLRNGSMVGLVHVVLAITLVSFTKTLSGDILCESCESQIRLMDRFQIWKSIFFCCQQTGIKIILDILPINRLESRSIFLHLHPSSLKPHSSSN